MNLPLPGWTRCHRLEAPLVMIEDAASSEARQQPPVTTKMTHGRYSSSTFVCVPRNMYTEVLQALLSS
jgi:hypothetical protein